MTDIKSHMLLFPSSSMAVMYFMLVSVRALPPTPAGRLEYVNTPVLDFNILLSLKHHMTSLHIISGT